MKQYLLLRNNQQTGPYTLEEIKYKNLQPFDLVWIENLSSQWQYASEIPLLKEHVKVVRKKYYLDDKKTGSELVKKGAEQPVITLVQVPIKERTHAHQLPKQVWKRRPFQYEGVKVAAIFALVVFTAFLIKQTADTSFGTGKTSLPDVPVKGMMQIQGEENPAFQNALVTEYISEDAMYEPAPGSVKPKDIFGQVHIKTDSAGKEEIASTLTLQNDSPHFIDRVDVRIDFTDEKGEVKSSQRYSVHAMKPFSKRKLEIPAQWNSFKIKSRVNRIYSKEYKAALKQA